jgi:hypothetical protein
MKEEILEQVKQALKYAILQIEETERRLVVQEFWNSLNRRKIISDDEVDLLITETLDYLFY